jgi:hypothetical protein
LVNTLQSIEVGFNRSRCFLNNCDVELIEERGFASACICSVAIVVFWSNTKALHSEDCCTWLEKLRPFAKGFLVCLMFRLQDGLGQKRIVQWMDGKIQRSGKTMAMAGVDKREQMNTV